MTHPEAMPTEPVTRQFCRTGQHTCVPAVTLTFASGGRLHWCAEHAADADAYRERADTVLQPVIAPQLHAGAKASLPVPVYTTAEVEAIVAAARADGAREALRMVHDAGEGGGLVQLVAREVATALGVGL